MKRTESLGIAMLACCGLLALCVGAPWTEAGDASAAPSGRGLFWRFTPEVLATDGYPDRQHESYWWPAGSEGSWGILYDDEGVPYGPNTYFQFETPLDHPDFALTDSTIVGRWFSMNRGTERHLRFHVRFMELMDLAYPDLRAWIGIDPGQKIQVYCPADLEEYQSVAGVGYWVSAVARGSHVVVEPPYINYRRDLWAHAARNAVAQSLIGLKCHGLAPPWFREGLAAYLAEEGNELLNFVNVYRPAGEVLWSPEETTRHAYPLVDVVKGRIALYNSFLMVWHLSETHGFDKVQAVLNAMEEGLGFERAVEKVYETPYTEIMSQIDPRVTGEPITTPRFRTHD